MTTMIDISEVPENNTDFKFEILFDSLVLIGTPMHRASEDERLLLDRAWRRIRARMVDALYVEV